MKGKIKKHNPKIIELCTLAVKSIGQDIINLRDRKEVEKILFFERNVDRAILRLCQIEANYKDKGVNKN